MKKKHFLATLVCTLALSGCARTEPIQNVHQILHVSYSDLQMKQAIISAGQSREWIMQAQQPGVIIGKLIQRGHTAEVRITYAASQYSINYISSQNLMAESGKVHRNYNRWVHNLDQDIQIRLARLTATTAG